MRNFRSDILARLINGGDKNSVTMSACNSVMQRQSSNRLFLRFSWSLAPRDFSRHDLLARNP
jgi:hypothetical protein